ncbi:hypothetical protein D3C80_464870 [compost metagenome]
MHIHEHAEIDNAAIPDLLDQPPHAAEILHPQRDRGMLEHALGITAVEKLLAAGLLALRHIFRGQKQPAERFFVAGYDRAAQLDIEPPAADRIIHRVAGKFSPARPEFGKLVHMAFQHVIAKNPVEIIDQMRLVAGLEQFQRPGIDLDDADFLRTGRHPR